MKVTAETITDEQIREVGPPGSRHFETSQMALSATGRLWWGEVITADMLHRARERLAAAWNARHGGES